MQDLVKDFFVGQFDVAIGEREGVRKKPAPDSVYEVLKEFDLKKDEVIYIAIRMWIMRLQKMLV